MFVKTLKELLAEKISESSRDRRPERKEGEGDEQADESAHNDIFSHFRLEKNLTSKYEIK